MSDKFHDGAQVLSAFQSKRLEQMWKECPNWKKGGGHACVWSQHAVQARRRKPTRPVWGSHRGYRRHKSGRESIMQNARSSYADHWGSFGHCGTTNTAEVTEGADTFLQNP